MPTVIGDKTEGSLLLLSHTLNMPIDDLRENGKLVEEFAFTSLLKMMTVIWKYSDKTSVFTKGLLRQSWAQAIQSCRETSASHSPCPA